MHERPRSERAEIGLFRAYAVIHVIQGLVYYTFLQKSIGKNADLSVFRVNPIKLNGKKMTRKIWLKNGKQINL